MKTIKMLALLSVLGMSKVAASAPSATTPSVSKLGKLYTFASKQVEKVGKGLTSAKDWMKQQVPSTETMSKWLDAQVGLVKNNPKKSIAIAVSAAYICKWMYNYSKTGTYNGTTHKPLSRWQMFKESMPCFGKYCIQTS